MCVLQFKQEISEDIAKMVARKTVSEVLKGLEGAVITSVRGSSGLGPLEQMFAAAAQTVVPNEVKVTTGDLAAKQRKCMLQRVTIV